MLNLFKKPAFGIDISDCSIEVLELISQNKVKSFGRIKLAKGIVKDGFIIDKKRLAENIKQVVDKAGIYNKRVILSLPESKVFIHIFKLDKNAKGNKLRDLIAQEAAKIIPLDPDKIYWDYQIISDGKEKEVIYIGTLKEIVDGYKMVLNKLGLEPIAFEVESIALERSLSQSRDYFSTLKIKNKPNGMESILTIDIGSRVTNINIFDDKHNLILSSIVPVAGDSFTQVISDKFKISLEKAEELKIKNGFNESKDDSKVADVLKEEIRPIIDASKKAINFYSQEIDEIHLVGGSSLIPGILEYFSVTLNIETNLGESFLAKELNIKNAKPVFFNTVVGLALRGIAKNPENLNINLLPGLKKRNFILEFINSNKKIIIRISIIILSLLIFISLGWFVYGYFFNDPKADEEPIEQGNNQEIINNETVIEEPEIIEPVLPPEEVIVSETETGWLNIREGAGINYPIISKAYPGESYLLLEENKEWYKIDLEDGEIGWISGKYATKK